MTMRAEQVGDPSGRAACAERRTRSARQIVLAPRRRARGARQSRRRFHFSSTGFFTANSAGDSCRSFIKSALRRSLRAMRSATTVGRRGVSSVVSSPREVSRMPKPAPPLSRRLEAIRPARSGNPGAALAARDKARRRLRLARRRNESADRRRSRRPRPDVLYPRPVAAARPAGRSAGDVHGA